MMAEALVAGLRPRLPHLRLHVFDVSEKRTRIFAQRFDATSHDCVKSCIDGADAIVLATKPQNLGSLAPQLRDRIDEKSLVISILAGTTIDTLKVALGHARVVRSIPNICAAVHQGMTVWSSAETTSEVDRGLAATILSAFGEELRVNDEKYLDIATSLSGSGPAYILLMMEAMIDTSVHMGLPRELATKITSHAIHGTAVYAKTGLEGCAMSVASLRADITSPGGTTASALYKLKEGRFETTLADGMWAAYKRSVDLGRGIDGKDSRSGCKEPG